VYLGFREDSIALAMSWLKVDEARTDGRKLTCGIFVVGRVRVRACVCVCMGGETDYESGLKLNNSGQTRASGRVEEIGKSVRGSVSAVGVLLNIRV